MYYKYMPKISIALIILCILYGLLMILGQLEYFSMGFYLWKIFQSLVHKYIPYYTNKNISYVFHPLCCMLCFY